MQELPIDHVDTYDIDRFFAVVAPKRIAKVLLGLQTHQINLEKFT